MKTQNGREFFYKKTVRAFQNKLYELIFTKLNLRSQMIFANQNFHKRSIFVFSV